MSELSATHPATHVDLAVTGMTCSSCAARIEQRLNRLDGVTATVNFAIEKAAVDYDPARVGPQELVAAVEAAGYRAVLPRPTAATPEPPPPGVDELVAWRLRLLVSTALTVPVVVMAMFPALQFTSWQWLSLTLAAPVAVWGAWPFHRAAWSNLRHGTATMDTLVSVGVLAAFGWSVWALFFGEAGTPGMTMPFSLSLSNGPASEQLYRALTNRTLSKGDGPGGHLVLSWNRAADFVNELRARDHYAPLSLAASGGEGVVSEIVLDELTARGWQTRSLRS